MWLDQSFPSGVSVYMKQSDENPRMQNKFVDLFGYRIECFIALAAGYRRENAINRRALNSPSRFGWTLGRPLRALDLKRSVRSVVVHKFTGTRASVEPMGAIDGQILIHLVITTGTEARGKPEVQNIGSHNQVRWIRITT